MQTITQTFLIAQNNLQFNISGRYFTTLATNLGINVRFYKGGQKKTLGDIQALLAGLEVTFEVDDYFDRVEIDVLGADTISFGIGNGQARYNRSQGNVNIVGTPNVNLANIPHVIVDTLPKVKIDAITYGSSYANNAALVANTAVQVFSAAANANGAIINSAQFSSVNATTQSQTTLLAKATAPANVTDGDAILIADDSSIGAGGVMSISGSLKNQILIPAGKALYFICANTETQGNRGVLYTLL